MVGLESQRIELLVFEPEVTIESRAQILSFLPEPVCLVGLAGARIEVSQSRLRQIDIALYLDERNRRRGETAVGIDDRIPGVFPSLVDQTFFRGALVLDVAIVVLIAVFRHPLQRRFDGISELVEKPQFSRPGRVARDQNQEKRRRVNRAVIGRLGNFIDMRHLAYPELMHDLARLLIAPFLDLAPLILRQQPECLLGHAGITGEGLERGDETIASK